MVQGDALRRGLSVPSYLLRRGVPRLAEATELAFGCCLRRPLHLVLNIIKFCSLLSTVAVYTHIYLYLSNYSQLSIKKPGAWCLKCSSKAKWLGIDSFYPAISIVRSDRLWSNFVCYRTVLNTEYRVALYLQAPNASAVPPVIPHCRLIRVEINSIHVGIYFILLRLSAVFTLV